MSQRDAVAEPRAVIVTGMSGAGRSQAANVLEDLGFFVVDNLPASLIPEVVDRVGLVEGVREKLAVVVDSRAGLTFEDLDRVLIRLGSRGVRTTVLYLDADDAALIRRYEETRRTHPVREGGLSDKIAAERKSLEEIRGAADVIIDTTELSVHDLRRSIEHAFVDDQPTRRMRVDVISFGFKRGVPRVIDLLFDVRFLPNPHWVPELRGQTGLDEPVRDYVLSRADSERFVEHLVGMLEFLVPRYEAEGKSYLTIGIGCTGGKHRSVAIAEKVASAIAADDLDLTVHHRDLPTGGA
jgi:UPF0042 nucleotide-binding protein